MQEWDFREPSMLQCTRSFAYLNYGAFSRQRLRSSLISLTSAGGYRLVNLPQKLKIEVIRE